MAKIIVAWCDRCLDADPDHQVTATTTVPIAVGPVGTRPKTMDLCEQCHKELLQPVLDALDSWGVNLATNPIGKPPKGVAKPAPGVGTAGPGRRPHRAVKAAEARPWGNATRQARRAVMGPFECGIPGCPSKRPSANLDAFYQHLVSRHGIKMGEYREQYGDPGPGRPDVPGQADQLAAQL